MDEIERLTSFLDGALEADERRALEHELAGDADLRSRLAAVARVDAALDEVAPVTLPEGARARLDARLTDAITAVVTPAAEPTADPATAPVTLLPLPATAPTTAEATGRPTDELAARRWWHRTPVLTGVAAALVLAVAGVAGVLGGLPLPSPGGDDAITADAMESVDRDAGALSLAPTEESAEDAGQGPGGSPVVVDEERRVGGTAVEELTAELLAQPELTDLAAQGLDAEQGAVLAALAQAVLLGPGADDTVTAQGSAPEAVDEPVIVTRDGRILPETDAQDLRRCLVSLLDAGAAAVPTTLELLEVDGLSAVAIGVVTPDPTTGAFTRREVWLLERSGCQVLRFAQS